MMSTYLVHYLGGTAQTTQCTGCTQWVRMGLLHVPGINTLCCGESMCNHFYSNEVMYPTVRSVPSVRVVSYSNSMVTVYALLTSTLVYRAAHHRFSVLTWFSTIKVLTNSVNSWIIQMLCRPTHHHGQNWYDTGANGANNGSEDHGILMVRYNFPKCWDVDTPLSFRTLTSSALNFWVGSLFSLL